MDSSQAAQELGLAFVSGNVSLYNESKPARRSSAPRPIVACVGALRRRVARGDAGLQTAGSALAVDRQPRTRGRRLGVSRVARCRRAAAGDFLRSRTRRDRDCRRRPVPGALLLACRAVGDGGMLTALARMAFDARLAGRQLGAELDFGNPFCETGGFVCEVERRERARR